MATVVAPKTTFAITPAPATIENAPQSVLMVGQKNGGTATAGELVTNIGNDGAQDSLFGERSMLATMIREFRKVNTVSRVDAISLDDPASAAAAGSIVFSGTAAAAGSYVVNIQSRKLHSFELPVASGDTAATLSSALATLVNADDTILVSTDGTTTPGTLDITSVHAGAVGNNIAIEVVGQVSGLSLTVNAITGGTLSPNLANLFDVVGDIRYQTIVWPPTYDKTEVADFLDARFNVSNAVLDGVAICSETDSDTNLIAEVASLNSESFVFFGNQLISTSLYKAGDLFEYDPTTASVFSAVRALRLTPNQNIAKYLVGGSITNAFGGPSRASTPYHNTPFSSFPLIDEEKGWTRAQQQSLLDNGVSFFGNNIANNEVIAGDVVTTYLTNAAGQPDETFKYLNYVDTASNVREFFYNNNQQQYAQSVLTTGDLVPGIRMNNAESIAVFQETLYRQLSGVDSNGVLYGLTQAGQEAFSFFEENLTVSIAIETGTVTIFAAVPIVTQLRTIDGTLQITFDLSVN